MQQPAVAQAGAERGAAAPDVEEVPVHGAEHAPPGPGAVAGGGLGDGLGAVAAQVFDPYATGAPGGVDDEFVDAEPAVALQPVVRLQADPGGDLPGGAGGFDAGVIGGGRGRGGREGQGPGEQDGQQRTRSRHPGRIPRPVRRPGRDRPATWGFSHSPPRHGGGADLFGRRVTG
ncbi:hypothetical protein ACFQFR_06915 [Streptomyces goshikiensis]